MGYYNYKFSKNQLNNAKYSDSNTDEWYTTYNTIFKELHHYNEQLRDKIVYCNADNPHKSKFCYYFLKHFNEIGLKKLICTSYSHPQMEQPENYILAVSEIGGG